MKTLTVAFVLFAFAASAQTTDTIKKTKKVVFSDVELMYQKDWHSNMSYYNVHDALSPTTLPYILEWVPNGVFRDEYPPGYYSFDDYPYFSTVPKYENKNKSIYLNGYMGFRKEDGKLRKHKLRFGIGYSDRYIETPYISRYIYAATDTIGEYYDQPSYITLDSGYYSIGYLDVYTNSFVASIGYSYLIKPENKLNMAMGVCFDIGFLAAKYNATVVKGYAYDDMSSPAVMGYFTDSYRETFKKNSYTFKPVVFARLNYRLNEKSKIFSKTNLFIEGKYGKAFTALTQQYRQKYFALGLGISYSLK